MNTMYSHSFIKLLTICSVFVLCLHVSVSYDVPEMIINLEIKLRELEKANRFIWRSDQSLLNSWKTYVYEDSGDKGVECFNELAKPFQELVALKLENIGRYIKMSRFLLGDLQNGRYNESELKDIKQMLSNDGSDYMQQETLQHALGEISLEAVKLDKSLHDKCFKHNKIN